MSEKPTEAVPAVRTELHPEGTVITVGPLGAADATAVHDAVIVVMTTYTLQDAAQVLGLSPDAARRALTRWGVKSTGTGSGRRWPRDAVDREAAWERRRGRHRPPAR